MEILINGEYLKVVEYKTLNKLVFQSLTTKQKLFLEEWMVDTIALEGQMRSAKDYKKDIHFFDDRKYGKFLGVFPTGAGDMSLSYTLSYDAKQIIRELEVKDIEAIMI